MGLSGIEPLFPPRKGGVLPLDYRPIYFFEEGIKIFSLKRRMKLKNINQSIDEFSNSLILAGADWI